MLIAAADGPSTWTQMLGSGLIGVREGLEAGIVVMVLVAFAAKSDRRDALKWIWGGVLAALAMTIGTFLVIHFGTSTMTSLAAELVAGIASLVAVVIVTYMVLWMRKASSHISGDLTSGLASALAVGGPAVFGLAFLAVGREGFETALLMVGYAESVSRSAWPLVGLLIGIAVAALLTYLIYRGAVKLNFRTFFTYTGLFLIVIAAGILSYGIHALQVYGTLPGQNSYAFDISEGFDVDSWYGVIASGIFNFDPMPTWLQVIAWVGYVAIVGTAFLLRGRTPATPKDTAPKATAPKDTAPTDPAPQDTVAADRDLPADADGAP